MEKKMVELIAEIGWNHMGDMSLAERMIKSAAESGADYAKFQTWSVDRLKPGDWDTDGRRQIYEAAELTAEKHEHLIQLCKEYDIKFLSSVFSVEDAKFLRGLGVQEVKIPSFECRNHDLIKYCDRNFEKIFMSTGTSTWKEIKESVSLIKDADLVLMHCVSSYPCEPSQANILKIEKLKEICAQVGYSDHIFGVESAKVAMKYDVCAIEKHFTVDQGLPGRDNKFAILPSDLKNLKEYVTMFEQMHTWHGEDFLDIEEGSRENYTGRFNG
jgi:N,N'-diacetyllegionaminate synthase